MHNAELGMALLDQMTQPGGNIPLQFGASHPELNHWIDFFTRDKHAAAYEFWYEIHKGIHEMLREYPV